MTQDNVKVVRQQFDAWNAHDPERLVKLLDDYISSDGLTIVIGTEHHTPDLQQFSLVVSTYSGGHGTGAVGVIGPRRMRYSRAIIAIASFSRSMNGSPDTSTIACLIVPPLK